MSSIFYAIRSFGGYSYELTRLVHEFGAHDSIGLWNR